MQLLLRHLVGSSLCASLVLGGGSAAAQSTIAYFRPDQPISIELLGTLNAQVNLDLNFDGMTDYVFGGGVVVVEATGDNRQAAVLATGRDLGSYLVGFPAQIEITDILPSEIVWVDKDSPRHLGIPESLVGACAVSGTGSVTCTGDFMGRSAFMGVHFQAPDGFHYGWVRIDATQPSSCWFDHRLGLRDTTRYTDFRGGGAGAIHLGFAWVGWRAAVASKEKVGRTGFPGCLSSSDMRLLARHLASGLAGVWLGWGGGFAAAQSTIRYVQPAEPIYATQGRFQDNFGLRVPLDLDGDGVTDYTFSGELLSVYVQTEANNRNCLFWPYHQTQGVTCFRCPQE